MKIAKKKAGPPPADKIEVVVRCAYGKMVDTNKIKPNPANPNTHPDVQVERLALLIKEHGWRHPITVSKRSGKVVSGHCRLLAARKLNLKQVPVDYQDFASDAEEYAVLIADNVVQELAQIDVLKMGDILGELQGANYDLALTALDPNQIEDYINGPLYDKGDVKDDEVPEPPKKPISKPGDLWLLGDHRLLCGDSTEKDNVERLMNRDKPHLMVTDPPYGVNYKPEWRTTNLKKGAKVKVTDLTYCHISGDERVSWAATFSRCPCTVAYVWYGGRHASEVERALVTSGFEIRVTIIWVKKNFPISRGHYCWRHEACFYAVKKGEDAHWVGGHKQSTVWADIVDVFSPSDCLFMSKIDENTL